MGFSQAAHLADWLGEEPLDAVVSSPLRRAIETARVVAEGAGVPLTVVDGLAEFDRHAREYVPIEEMLATGDPRLGGVIESGGWGDTSVDPAAFRDAVVVTLDEIIAQHRGRTVAVVCHGGVINSYLGAVLGLADPRGFFVPAYTGVCRVAASGSGVRTLRSVNEITHLRGTGIHPGFGSRPLPAHLRASRTEPLEGSDG